MKKIKDIIPRRIKDMIPERVARKVGKIVGIKDVRACIENGMLPSFPEYIGVELTNACHLECKHCNYRYGLEHYTRPRGKISDELFYKVADEIASEGASIMINYDGEPLLHPNFLKYARYVSERQGIKNIWFNNSGTLFKKEVADELASFYRGTVFFSVDGDREFHNNLRCGSDYDLVMGNLFYFLDSLEKKNNKNVKVGVSLCNVGHTAESRRRFLDYWKDKVHIVSMGEVNDKWGKIISEDIMHPFEVKERPVCEVAWSTMGVCWDGDIVVCSIYITRANSVIHGIMGNVKERTLKEVWEDKPYETFRQWQIKRDYSNTVCQGCERWKSQFNLGVSYKDGMRVSTNAFWTTYERVD